MRIIRAGVLGVVLTLAASSAWAGVDFRLQSVIPLPGASPSWDYLAFDPGSQRLYVARRKDGVIVLDVAAGRVVGQVERSEGADIAALAPALGRGFTANEDGTSTIFDLATLKAIDRVKLGEGADSAFYEPSTKQVVFTLGDDRELAFLDASSGKITGRTAMDAEELEAVAVDGDGVLYVAERDRDSIGRVDARTRRLTATWKVSDCHMPVGMAIDRERGRLFVGCRGDHPVLAVLDAVTGKLVAQLPIGRGNDGIIYDPQMRRIYTSNGLDANVVMVDQLDADTYRFAGAFTTRPLARTLAFDPKSRRLFTATADGLVDPARPINLKAGPFYPNLYADDTFAVLVYAPRPGAVR